MAKAHWLIKQRENGRLFALKASRRGKRFSCTRVLEMDTPANLSGKVDMVLESKKTIVLIGDFAQTKGKILDLEINRKIDQLALFEVSEKVAIVHRFLGNRRHLQRLSVIAIPEEPATASIKTILADGSRKLRICIAEVAAIASLLQQVGSEPFIALCINEDRAFIAGIQDGAVLSLQTVPLGAPALVESGVAAHAIGFARRNMGRDFELDDCRLVCFGGGRDNFDFAGLAEDDLVPDWSHWLDADGDDIMHYPELFGLLFTSPDTYSFLSPPYRVASHLRKIAGLLAGGAVVGSLVLATLAYLQNQASQPLLLQLTKEKNELSEMTGDIRRLIPDEDEFRRIKIFKDIRDKADAEPSAGRLLAGISRVLPSAVYIVELEIIRGTAVVKKESRVGQSLGEQLLNRPLVIKLICTSQGEFSHVRARFNQTAAGLSSVFLLETVDWQYDESTQSGYFSGSLSVLAEKK